MRRLPKSKPLRSSVLQKLAAQTALIAAAADQQVEAERLYRNARKAVWFSPIVQALKMQAGSGERCMLCSGSEASDVEHYKPKGVFPLLAMTSTNYLWSCTPCNRSKGTRFPPDNAPGAMLLNPLLDDVWEFFFIDQYGFMTAIFDPVVGAPNDRGSSTEEFLNLNRDALQATRLARIKDLKEKVRTTTKQLQAGEITVIGAKRKISVWCSQPFQPDVADYFLIGPGKGSAPFRAFFEALR